MDSIEHVQKLKELASDFTILFVEDSKALQTQVVKFLSKLFKEVLVASDGQEGLILYEKHNPDLVLTDLTMPKLTGHEMIREIKKINPDVEVVILSAHSDSETLMKSFHIGVSDFIAKPVNAAKMITVFLKVLSNMKRKEYQVLELASEDTQNFKDDEEILSFLFENSMKIDIINHYKGVPIINSGKILEIDEDRIKLRTTHLQLLAINEEDKAILDSSLISEDILCSVEYINLNNYEVTLKKEKLFHPEFKDRNEIVIEPDKKTKAFINNNEQNRLQVKILGISTKEFFLNIEKEKFFYEKHDLVNLLIVFSKDKENEFINELEFESRVFKINEKENGSLDVILLVKESEEINTLLQKYILKREVEVVEEFKAKFQYS